MILEKRISQSADFLSGGWFIRFKTNGISGEMYFRDLSFLVIIENSFFRMKI